jgi:hypothetical protein
MKPKILLSCAVLVFCASLVLLVYAGWNGNASVKLAWPVSGTLVQFAGTASGWRPLAGIGGLLLTVVLFLWGLISLATRPLRRRRAEPEPQPEAAVNRQAASQ